TKFGIVSFASRATATDWPSSASNFRFSSFSPTSTRPFRRGRFVGSITHQARAETNGQRWEPDERNEKRNSTRPRRGSGTRGGTRPQSAVRATRLRERSLRGQLDSRPTHSVPENRTRGSDTVARGAGHAQPQL